MSSVAPSIATPFQIARPSRCIGTETSSTVAPAPARRVGRLADGGVDVGLRQAGQLEALAQHADAQALGPAVEALDVRRHPHADLARIEPVLAGEHLEHRRRSRRRVRAIGPTWSIVSSIGKMPV